MKKETYDRGMANAVPAIASTNIDPNMILLVAYGFAFPLTCNEFATPLLQSRNVLGHVTKKAAPGDPVLVYLQFPERIGVRGP